MTAPLVFFHRFCFPRLLFRLEKNKQSLKSERRWSVEFALLSANLIEINWDTQRTLLHVYHLIYIKVLKKDSVFISGCYGHEIYYLIHVSGPKYHTRSFMALKHKILSWSGNFSHNKFYSTPALTGGLWVAKNPIFQLTGCFI